MEKQLSSTIPLRGLNTDSPPKHQPEGTYRYALNAVPETTAGDHATLSNELGNTICGITGKQMVGHVLMDKQEIFVALYPDEVGIYYPERCEYKTVSQDSC